MLHTGTYNLSNQKAELIILFHYLVLHVLLFKVLSKNWYKTNVKEAIELGLYSYS